MDTGPLAAEGGTPVRTERFPSVGDISGRDLGEEEISYLTEVIRSGKLFRYGGKFVNQFEQEFAQVHSAKHALAVTSGSAALHTALAATNPEPGLEVITSPITDMGSVLPILHLNCIPIFADLDRRTYNLDPASVAAKVTDKTHAIIAVHLFGQMCDMDPLLEIARKRNLYLIEDACQAYLAEYKGHLAGTMGHIGAFSMQQSKHLTAGDGGLCITNDDALAERGRLFADKAWPRTAGARGYLFLGINYRMNELTGAVGLAQLHKVRGCVERRRANAARLTARLAQVPGVNPPHAAPERKHSYWQYVITIDEKALGVSPADFTQALNAEGIPAGVGYIGRPIYMSPVLKDKRAYGAKSRCPWDCHYYGRDLEYREEDCPNTLECLRTMIVIPWNEQYSEQDVNDIADGLEKVAGHYRARA
jgi:dTDP-4-amino-4,6-dideoxygalactose transaminase